MKQVYDEVLWIIQSVITSSWTCLITRFGFGQIFLVREAILFRNNREISHRRSHKGAFFSYSHLTETEQIAHGMVYLYESHQIKFLYNVIALFTARIWCNTNGICRAYQQTSNPAKNKGFAAIVLRFFFLSFMRSEYFYQAIWFSIHLLTSPTENHKKTLLNDKY